jgi:polyisoprenoid-binding protein YceI
MQMQMKQQTNRRSTSRMVALLAGVLITASSWADNVILKEHRVEWSGAMPVQTHTGSLQAISVDATVGSDGSFSGLRVELDMTSIRDEDLQKEGARKKLEKHLSSEDFFYVEKFPVASFEMKSFDGKSMAGTLTIRGVSKEIAIPADFKKTGDGTWTLAVDFSFNRQDFNVNYQNSGIFGTAKNKLIADNVGVKATFVFAAP